MRGAAILATTLAVAAALIGCTEDGRQATPSTSLASGFGFFFVDEGGSAKLAYGEANSDNVGLMMECAKGSKVVEVSDMVRSAAAPVLTLVSDGRSSELKAEAVAGEGAPVVVARAASSTPALASFRQSGTIEVAYAGLRYGIAAKPHERVSVERFFSACDGRSA